MNIYEPAVIMSAELAELSPGKNWKRTIDFEEDLKKANLSFTKVLGSYKGIFEKSFLITPVLGDVWDDLTELADKYGQESLLYINSNRYTQLYYPCYGTWHGLGQLCQVTRDVAEAQDSWLMVGDNYYVAEQ